MHFPKAPTNIKIKAPLKNSEDIDSDALPHIKKFERQTEDEARALSAREQSERIFGPFRSSPTTSSFTTPL